MLVLALGATLVGFVLLVAALFSGVLWLAIACIVVCVVGVGFLIADLLGLGRDADGSGERDRDRSEQSDREEGPDSGTSGEVADGGDVEWDSGGQPESDDTDTGPIPRASRPGSDDPPTEEIRLDKPR